MDDNLNNGLQTEETPEEVHVELRGIKNSTDDYGHTVMTPMELHGRRQIFTDTEKITRENVVKVLNKALYTHNRNRREEVYLQKYDRGIQPILDRVKQYNDYVCNRIVVNIANQINTFKTSEFAGEAIQYVSRSSDKEIPKKIEKLNSMMISEGKRAKDYELAYKMFCNGVSYRLILKDKAKDVATGELFDEAPFEIYIPDPKNTFVVRLNDIKRRVVMGVTYVYLDENHNRVRYTVYTENETFEIEGSALQAEKVVKSVRHNFGMVTLVEYAPNPIYMGSFEVVLPLLDAYNLCLSDRMDGIEQFIQALMVFEGVDITREEFLELKDLGAIKLPPSMDGRASRLYYLSQQLDQSQTQTLVDDMYQTILRIVGMPSQGNAKTSDSSNNGAMIIKNGWWNAEARALETEALWRESETETLRIILKICDEANVLSGLKVSDVEPKFGRRSYEDKAVKTQSFTTLMSAGVPPIQAYTISGMVTDPEAAAIGYEEYQKEREEALGLVPEMARGIQVGRMGGGGQEQNVDHQGDDDDDNRRRRRRGRQMVDRDGDGIVGER